MVCIEQNADLRISDARSKESFGPLQMEESQYTSLLILKSTIRRG